MYSDKIRVDYLYPRAILRLLSAPTHARASRRRVRVLGRGGRRRQGRRRGRDGAVGERRAGRGRGARVSRRRTQSPLGLRSWRLREDKLPKRNTVTTPFVTRVDPTRGTPQPRKGVPTLKETPGPKEGVGFRDVHVAQRHKGGNDRVTDTTGGRSGPRTDRGTRRPHSRAVHTGTGRHSPNLLLTYLLIFKNIFVHSPDAMGMFTRHLACRPFASQSATPDKNRHWTHPRLHEGYHKRNLYK